MKTKNKLVVGVTILTSTPATISRFFIGDIAQDSGDLMQRKNVSCLL